MKKAPLYFCLLIVVLFALILRLYPTVISGMPFSTDSWPLIRNTELLIQNTPVPLNSGIFDSYNNFWPGNQLFGAVLSQVTSLAPITAMSFGIPIAATCAIPLFFFLVKKIAGNANIALAASLMLAAAATYTFYCAGVTKEAFASPLYITSILLFLLKHDKKTTLLFSLTSIALALTHHFTAFFAMVIFTALTIAFYVSKGNGGQQRNSFLSNLLFTGIQATITIAYFCLFAAPQFSLSYGLPSLLTVFAYQILFAGLTLWFVYGAKSSSPKSRFFKFIFGSVVAIAFMYVLLNMCTLPGAHLLYELPLIIGLPIAVFGLVDLQQRNTALLVPLFWLISVLAFTGFAVFANPIDGSGLAWRSMNFLLPPLIILIATGAYRLYSTPKQVKPQGLIKSVTVLLILAIVAMNAYGMYQTVSEKDSSLGYFWLYSLSDYKAADWIATNANNQTTGGDARVDYLLRQYFNKPVSYVAGLRYLEGNGPAPELLYVYNQMKEDGKGYVLAGVPISLPANWTDKLSNYDCVYSNDEVTVYARR